MMNRIFVVGIAIAAIAIVAGCGNGGADAGYQAPPKSSGERAAGGNQPIVQPAEQSGANSPTGQPDPTSGDATPQFGGRR